MNINRLIEQDVYTMKNIPFLKIITIILVLISTKQVLSQTPIINSFSPQSGYVGIIVRIYGSYFRLDDQPVLASNQLNKPPINWTSVRFGDHQAIPTVVTSTYIEVPVPEIQVGLYKIWVLNANGGTESSTYFNVTPPPPQPITNISFYLVSEQIQIIQCGNMLKDYLIKNLLLTIRQIILIMDWLQ